MEQSFPSQSVDIASVKINAWLYDTKASLMAQTVKKLPVMQATWVWSLDWEDSLENEMATHSSVLAWRIPWTEEPGRLQSMGSQRVWHDWTTSACVRTHTHTHTHTHSVTSLELSGLNSLVFLTRPWLKYFIFCKQLMFLINLFKHLNIFHFMKHFFRINICK